MKIPFSRLLMSTTITLLCGSVATAQNEDFDDIPKSVNWGGELGLIRKSTLKVADEVTDNCWTNSSSIRSRVYLTYEANEIFVPDYEPKFLNFETVVTTLSAFGFRTSSGICAISATFDVQTLVNLTLGGAEGKSRYSFNYAATIFKRSSIFTNSANVNAPISDFFEGAASEFVAQTIAARRSSEILEYQQDYPSENKRPMSVEEWDAMIETWMEKQNN